jgi:hypothetical protein
VYVHPSVRSILFRDLGKMTFFSGGDGGWIVRLELRTLHSLDRHSIT